MPSRLQSIRTDESHSYFLTCSSDAAYQSPGHQAQSLPELLQAYSILSSHCLELVEGCSPSIDREEAWLASSRTLPLVIPLLVNLSSISLGCKAGILEWRRISRLVKSSLRDAFILPGLTGVKLYNLSFGDSVNELLSLFINNASLKYLSLLGVQSAGLPVTVSRAASTSRPQLVDLSISVQWTDTILRHIYGSGSSVDLTHVRKLRVADIQWASVCRLLEDTHESLEPLEIWQNGCACLLIV